MSDDAFLASLNLALQPTYLGNPEVVSAAVSPFIAAVIDHTAGRLSSDDLLSANRQLTRVFSGEDPAYTAMPGWHTAHSLGATVVMSFDLDPSRLASEPLSGILTEAFAAVSVHLKDMLNGFQGDPMAIWDPHALVQLNRAVNFVESVLLGTSVVAYSGKTLKDFFWRPVTVAPGTSGKAVHPRPDDKGKPVVIKHPSLPSPFTTWLDPSAVVTVTPDWPAIHSLNGLTLSPWASVPKTSAEWAKVPGRMADLQVAPLTVPGHLKPAAGVVIEEPDGRVWLVAPSNGFGGYQATFPKGRVEYGVDLQATAIREAFEESGLQVAITGHLADTPRSQTMTRYFTARRVGGTPSAMGWESQAVHLVPKADLAKFLSSPYDAPLLKALCGPQ